MNRRVLPILALFAGLAGLASLVTANPSGAFIQVIEPVEGETVYVRTDEKESQVEAIYQLGTEAGPIEEIYFPIFVAKGTKVAAEVAGARLSGVIDGVPLDRVAVATPRIEIRDLPRGVEILWLQFSLPDEVTRASDRKLRSNLLRVSYCQKSIGGKFYYLPMNVPKISDYASTQRRWNNTMVVRSPSRVVASPIGNLDLERLGELLVIYLQEQQLVVIPTK